MRSEIELTGTPHRLLSRRDEERLGLRHREVLDQLESIFLTEGFASVTVGQLAAGVGCSRRTLYELASSKDELVLVVLDRFLHRVGRHALEAIDRNDSFGDQVRAYLHGGLEMQRQTVDFADDLADNPAAQRLLDRHFRFAMSVVEQLVAAGVEAGEFRAMRPATVAGVLVGADRLLTQPHMLEDLGIGRDEVSTEIVELVLVGLTPS